MQSQLLPEPGRSDSEHEGHSNSEHESSDGAAEEEDTPEKHRVKRRRAASTQQQAEDRRLMPPPAPRPARGSADRSSSGDGAPAHASTEAQASLERPSQVPPRTCILRWNRRAPSTAELRQDLVQHGLFEVRFLVCSS